MKLLLALLCLGFLFSFRSQADPAVDRLKQLATDIRAKKQEADAEVQKMRGEAKDITDAAEKESARIRAEAEAYTKAIEEEIRQIQKGMPGQPPAAVSKAPNREEISKLLSSLVDPVDNCLTSSRMLASSKRADAVEKCTMGEFRRKFQPYFSSTK